MYRDTWNTVNSFNKVYGSGWQWWAYDRYLRYSPHAAIISKRKQGRYIAKLQVLKDLKICIDPITGFVLSVICSAIAEYLELHGQGWPICAFRYEDMLEDTEYSLKVLFKYVDLPLDLIPKGMEAMKKDSQRGSSMSKESTKYAPSLGEYTGKNKQLLESALKTFGIPTYEELRVLPDTINHK